MKVDIHSLGVFSQLARRGSEQAAASLGQLTGANVRVDVTNISLLTRDDFGETFGNDEYVGVQIGFGGPLDGDTILAFERDRVGTLLDLLMPGTYDGDELDEFARSGIQEVGNIMMSGFIDGWANHLGTTIDITPPTYIQRSGVDLFPAVSKGDEATDAVFLFESRLEAVDHDFDFFIYMLPEYGALTELMADHRSGDQEAIPVDRLSVFNRMTKQGAERAADNIATMTGLKTNVDVSRLSFASIEDVPCRVGNERLAGVVLGFDGLPSGYLLILFDEQSAHRVVDALLPSGSDGSGFDEMARSAIKELGNVMTSGFIDGWANVLGTTITHTPPQFVDDMGSSIVSPIVARLGQTQDYAFLIDSTVETDGERFRCDIYALPDERELTEALEKLVPERLDRAEADVDGIF